MKTSFKLSVRFIIKSPFQSLLIVLVMFLGLASLLFLTTLFTSLNLMIENNISNYDAHIVITRKNGQRIGLLNNELEN